MKKIRNTLSVNLSLYYNEQSFFVYFGKKHISKEFILSGVQLGFAHLSILQRQQTFQRTAPYYVETESIR
jgi:hypothetical protein